MSMSAQVNLRHELGIILSKVQDVGRSLAELPEGDDAMLQAYAHLSQPERQQLDEYLGRLSQTFGVLRERFLRLRHQLKGG